MTIFEQQMEQGRLHARLDTYKRKLDYALAGIEAMRALAPRSYLSLSWGKQSIVLAHMLYHIQPDIPMYFLASGESFLIHNFEQVIDEFTARWPVNLHIVRRDHVYDGQNLDWQASRDAGERDLQTMVNREDWDGWYWGLAKDESRDRRITLSLRWDGQPHPTIFRYTDGKYRCCPLANWTVLDLAAYISTHDIPLLDQYKELGLHTRTTARITRKAAECGGVLDLKRKDMSAFNRLCERFPELRLRT